jgi:hypothetical protein
MHGARRRVRLVMAAVLLGSLIPAASVAPAGATAPTDPLDLAISHVRDNAAEFGLGGTDVAELTVTSQVKSKHNGVTHVNLNQNYRGLEVFGANGTVNISADGRVLFVGESFAGGLEAASSANPDLDATAAVESAASSLGLAEPDNLIVLEDGGTDEETIVSAGGISNAPIPARLGWQPSPGGLRLAWQVTIDSSSSASLWNATVDASTGILLAADDWTDSDDIGVLSSTLSRAGSTRARTSVNILTPFPAEDGSSYRVLEIPKESPLDGPFNDVSEPADERVSPFGWHDNGVTSYTTTQGNNVHAFMDQDANNQPDFGSSPDGGLPLDFLEDPDLNEHAQAYRDAATTNLFYWNNVIHDITALYGFDEAADNFQTINYGGGGNGDYVRAEAADGNGTNNANFSTPSAGGTPRMQMYLWPGNQLGSQNQVTVGADAYGAGWARFGPPAPSAGISGTPPRARR